MSKISFSYRGISPQGTEVRDTVEALDKEDALAKLRLLEARGLRDLVIEDAQVKEGAKEARTTLKPWQVWTVVICIGVMIWSQRVTPKPSKSVPATAPTSQSSLMQEKKDRELVEYLNGLYRKDGLEISFDVKGAFMRVNLSPEVYRALFSDRIAANKIIRGWQKLLSDNYGTAGVGEVSIYSGDKNTGVDKVAEAIGSIWSDEVKVKWFDA